MIVEYLFSSPEGDIFLEPEDLARPFLTAPEKAHPHLTLGNYLDTIKACVLKDQGELLKRALKGVPHGDFHLEEVRKIRIRSEKHGILYHLASVEVFMAEKRVKFTLSTAISETGVACIMREHDILDQLNRNSEFSLLPEIYGIRKMTCHTAQGKAEEMVMLAAQWFEDYHEWHFSKDPLDGERKLQIWDLKKGPRYAAATETSAIIEECSKLLSLYYDFEDFSQIIAWHHAAGDFIVKCHGDGPPDVRLTTVRQYAPLVAVFSGNSADPMIAVIYFFLDTTLRMRLDRLDGVGETVWLDEFAVNAAVRGIFEGFRHREAAGAPGIRTSDLLTLMQSFGEQDLKKVFDPLLAFYETRDSDEAALIIVRLDNHIRSLCQALRDFH